MNPKRLAPLLLVLALPSGAAVDPFYQGLLRDGQFAFDRKDYATAARDLRLACFGMLEEPRQLADCLVRLALAQDRINDVEGFRETFRRLVEIEERFQAYSRSDLAPDLRTSLEQRLAARVPAATLAAAPAFRPATATPPLIQVGPAGAKPLSPAELEKLDLARQLLTEPRPASEVKRAFELAREVADAHPEFKEAQHLAAEGAYRMSRWSDVVRYFQRGGDPGEDKPERLFYLAVALHESGDAAGAAAALERALPNLKRTPYVDSYAKKILGQ
jgi:hypothetical protein